MANGWLTVDHYRADIELAVQAIARELREGTIALFLGAGVSVSMGLPDCAALVQLCREDAKLPALPSPLTSELMRRGMEEVEKTLSDGTRYRELVANCLYRNVRGEDHMLSQPLLIALGALTMKSRRGSVREVVTFNFDDVLERYLHLHGVVHHSIWRLRALRPEADVNVYHPNGYLPFCEESGDPSDRLFFSQYSYDERTGDPLDPWKPFTDNLFVTKVMLFVGLSCHDPVLGAWLVSVQKETEPQRPTGFWLLGPDDDDPRSEEFLMPRNVAPIRLKSYNDYPRFLLRVCQEAARG